MTSKDIGIQTQHTVVFKLPEMTFREYDKKMLSFRPDLEYWELVLEEFEPWERKDKKGDYIYDDDEQKQIRATDRLARSIYIQGNSNKSDVYTSYNTAYEIREALRGRYENTEAWALTELTQKYNDAVRNNPYACPDEWFDELQYQAKLIIRTGGGAKTDGEIVAHVIATAPKIYDTVTTILQGHELTDPDIIKIAREQYHNYWKRHVERSPNKYKSRENVAAYAVEKDKSTDRAIVKPNVFNKLYEAKKSTSQTTSRPRKPWRKFKGKCRECGVQGHKAVNCPTFHSRGKETRRCFKCGKVGHLIKDCTDKSPNDNGPSKPSLFIGSVDMSFEEREVFFPKTQQFASDKKAFDESMSNVLFYMGKREYPNSLDEYLNSEEDSVIDDSLLAEEEVNMVAEAGDIEVDEEEEYEELYADVVMAPETEEETSDLESSTPAERRILERERLLHRWKPNEGLRYNEQGVLQDQQRIYPVPFWRCYHCLQKLKHIGNGQYQCDMCRTLAVKYQYKEPGIYFGWCKECDNLGPEGEICHFCILQPEKQKGCKKHVISFLHERYKDWDYLVPLDEAIMFNYVSFMMHQGFELDWWCRMLTKQVRVGNELHRKKWLCPFIDCFDKLQVLDRCISCKYYTKDDSIANHSLSVTRVIGQHTTELASIKTKTEEKNENPPKKSKTEKELVMKKDPPRFLRMETRIRIEYTLHHLQVIGPSAAMKVQPVRWTTELTPTYFNPVLSITDSYDDVRMFHKDRIGIIWTTYNDDPLWPIQMWQFGSFKHWNAFEQKIPFPEVEILAVEDVTENDEAGKYGHCTKHNSVESWLFDTGASVHVTPSDRFLFNQRNCRTKVKVAEGTLVESYKQGDLLLRSHCGAQVKLTDVLVIPSFAKNIISGSKLVKGNNQQVQINEDGVRILNKDSILYMLYNPSTRLWYMNGIRLPEDKLLLNTVNTSLLCNKEEPTSISTTSPMNSENNELCVSFTSKSSIQSVMDQESILNQSTGDNLNKQQQIKININDAHQKFGHINERLLRSSMGKYGYKVFGTFVPCHACMLFKAKRRAVAKLTLIVATRPGERIHIDTSGPFPSTLGGHQYWVKIKDQFSGMSWNSFVKQKSEVSNVLLRKLRVFKGIGIQVSYLRCDNAGEHQESLQLVCEEFGIQLEYTAPSTPQQNGLVERQFVTDLSRANSMMEAADFTQSLRNLLRGEAIMTASILDNLACKTNNQSAFELFYNRQSLLAPKHFQPFGRLGYITIRDKIRSKLKPKATICVFVGYAMQHSPNTYRFYNPSTRSIILSRDVSWSSWQTVDPKQTLNLYRRSTITQLLEKDNYNLTDVHVIKELLSHFRDSHIVLDKQGGHFNDDDEIYDSNDEDDTDNLQSPEVAPDVVIQEEEEEVEVDEDDIESEEENLSEDNPSDKETIPKAKLSRELRGLGIVQPESQEVRKLDTFYN